MSTLTDDELAAIKRELLDHVLDYGAEPYIGVRPVYAIIRDNVRSSATPPTTSSSAVTAATIAAGVGTTITVASASGLAVGYKVALDADDNFEVCTVKSLSGTTVGLNCRKPHGGTYNVEIESPLTIVRAILWKLAKLADVRDGSALDAAGIKRADEVEFFGPNDGGSVADQIARAQARLRFELASAVGLRHVLAAAGGASSKFEQY